MHLLEFNVKLKTSKPYSELIRVINDILESNFDQLPYENGGDWIMWKCDTFGLELTICYFSDTDEYYVSGCRSEKVASLIPLEYELKQTDISVEMLDMFKVVLPEGNWCLD